MVMLDANVILRYLLNDDDRMASEAIIKNMPVQVNIEIVAEVVYVLKGVYHIDKMEIGQCLLEFTDLGVIKDNINCNRWGESFSY